VLSAGVAIMLVNMYKLSPAFREEMDAIMAAAMALDFSAAWQLMNINLAIALVETQQHFHDAFSAVKNTVMSASDWIGDMLIQGFDRFLGLFGSDILWLQGQLDRLGEYFKAAFDWEFARNGLSDALKAVDDRVEMERARLPNADARAQERAAERERRANDRKAADAAAQGLRPGVVEELKAERERIKKKAEDGRKKKDDVRKNEAKRGELQMPAMDFAVGGMTAKSIGTFSSAIAGMIGVGPEIQTFNAIEDNTRKAANALENMMQDNFKNANPLGDINAVKNAIEAAGGVPAVPGAGDNAALVTPMEQTAASVAESARHLRNLVDLARNGGLAFA
jgi:hypothetical protein